MKYVMLSFLKNNRKLIFILIFSIIILIFIAFKLLSTYSYSYNNWLAEKEFNKMCNFIKTTEIDYIQLTINDNCAEINIEQINNINELSKSLTYSKLSPENSTSIDKKQFIGFQLYFSNNASIDFGTINSTDFKVTYNQKTFYVKSPVLTEFIGSDTFTQLQKDWNSLA